MIEIRNLVDCCGCNACVQRCPKQCFSMRNDKEGFWYPVVDKTACINCGLCEKVCPQINIGQERKPLATFAYKHSEKDIQKKSSSGGAFTLLASTIINEGGVIFGAAFDKNWNVVHERADTIGDLEKLRMSKYVQSDIGETFKQAENLLKKGCKVLFVGTPCQIHGLKLFLRKDYENLLCIDFICHGVPSPKAWQKYLKDLTAGEKNSVSFLSKHQFSKQYVLVKGIQFRNKRFGWKKYSFVLHYNLAEPTGDSEKNTVSSPLYTDKVFAETLDKNSYLRGFIRDLYLRPCCYECRNKSFKSGSDITLGDFWGIENTYPSLYDENGVSCMMVNTERGASFLNNYKDILTRVDYSKVFSYNPSLEKPVGYPPFRSLFFKLMGIVPFGTLVLIGLAYNKIFRFFKHK